MLKQNRIFPLAWAIYSICFLLLFTCVAQPVMASTDSFGMDFRKIQRLLLENTQQSLGEAEQVFNQMAQSSRYTDEKVKQEILERFKQGKRDEIAPKMLQLSYLGVKQALENGDIKEAKNWFEIREQKLKFNKEATKSLQSMVELQQNPDKLNELKPIILKDLKEIYLFKIRDSLSDAKAVSQSYLFFQIIEQDLIGDISEEQVKELHGILQQAFGKEQLLAEADKQKAEEILGSYFAKQVSPEELKSQTSKIIKLLDYMDRNWTVAIKEGAVFNGVEYEELKAFSTEAQLRFRQIHDAWPSDADKIESTLVTIEKVLADKKNKEEVTAVITQLMGKLSKDAGVPLPTATTSNDNSPEAVMEQTLAKLDQTLEAYKAGKKQEAYDLVFDAYFVFEPIESKLSAKDNQAVLLLEQKFAELKALIQAGKEIEPQVTSLKEEITKSVTTLTTKSSGWSLFIQSLIIILREGFEAIIIIAALAAYLTKTGQPRKYVFYGAGIAILASVLAAYLIKMVFQISGANQEAIEGITMLIAVTVLFYVSYWMISQVQGRRWQQYIQGKLADSVAKGSYYTMGFVSFLAVFREGFETILFYQALLAIGNDSSSMVIYGFLVGCVVLAILYYSISKFSVKIPIKPFFLCTSAILYFMAFSFTGHGIFELQEGGYISSTFLIGWPTVSLLGIYPTIETMVAQSVLILAVVVALGWMLWKKGAKSA
ncbi:FTR1 family iron permease [Brevibacillus sp. SYSU BS000544]|uniref:FTR1 family iron permease n=1 Tax=Brevibacillus sp. SYSU BS000544 TaxID=3416443 RepID=UPI003CE4E9D3